MKFFDRPALSAVLADGTRELDLALTPQQHEQLLDYLALLFKPIPGKLGLKVA